MTEIAKAACPTATPQQLLLPHTIAAPPVEMPSRVTRPWGHYESLVFGPNHQVKRITVTCGGRLSLQSHQYRAEHWVVVSGRATVTVGQDRHQLMENESVYIPRGEVHRLENEDQSPLVLIEVQYGTYFGEDDIARYDDIYGRI